MSWFTYTGYADNAEELEADADHDATRTMLSLDEAMRLYIETALGRTSGRIEGPSGVAVVLKINPHDRIRGWILLRSSR